MFMSIFAYLKSQKIFFFSTGSISAYLEAVNLGVAENLYSVFNILDLPSVQCSAVQCSAGRTGQLKCHVYLSLVILVGPLAGKGGVDVDVVVALRVF
jgi:hypothetical protein